METTEIKNICQQIADIYKNKMQQAGYNQQGELMNFTWVTEYNGSMFALYFILPDYWVYAEEGRRPGKFPPPDAILKWIQFKRLVPRPYTVVPDTKQTVFIIANAIKKKKGMRKLPNLTMVENYVKEKGIKLNSYQVIPTTKQLAYIISRKIAEEGTKGKHLLQQTIDETYDSLVDQLVEAITNQLEQELEKDIEKVTK